MKTQKHKIMKVRIVKAELPTYWYAKRIGQEFEVQHYKKNYYELVSDTDYVISKIDCEIIEEPTTIVDYNGIQTEPFTPKQKKVIAVEKDIKKCEIYALLLEDFKKANELQRIGLIEIFQELGYNHSDTVKLIRTIIDEL